MPGMAQIVKRAYKYRFYPIPEQASQLARTFGCVRLCWQSAGSPPPGCARPAAPCGRRCR
ncbi:helix-turn-helix domain-containing protein [Nonomuraea maheshkhaliensis]|uniref:helix-turn-helix domain-containing protein n=1 Tax=Nonomuraea maheshkhaliensis TaxID=419590 RepID=UPI003D15F1BC